jgi:short-subunit dehydrogenase
MDSMTKPLAVILGAGPGIGLAAARRFGQEGFNVALVSRPSDPREAFQAALEADGTRALALGTDLSARDRLEETLAVIQAWGGRPEVLVYNASAGTPGAAADLGEDALMKDLQVNVAAPLAAVQWALPGMREAGRGTLLFTGGGLALHPKPGMASACLGKAALRSLALSLGEELAPEGIHAATVTVRGFVQAGTALDARRVAQAFWELHGQAQGAWIYEICVQ